RLPPSPRLGGAAVWAGTAILASDRTSVVSIGPIMRQVAATGQLKSGAPAFGPSRPPSRLLLRTAGSGPTPWPDGRAPRAGAPERRQGLGSVGSCGRDRSGCKTSPACGPVGGSL